MSCSSLPTPMVVYAHTDLRSAQGMERLFVGQCMPASAAAGSHACELWVSGLFYSPIPGYLSPQLIWLPRRDFATQVQRIIALGFNTVKVPFSFNDLYGLVPNNYTEPCTQVTAQQLQVSQLPCPNVMKCYRSASRLAPTSCEMFLDSSWWAGQRRTCCSARANESTEVTCNGRAAVEECMAPA